MYISQSFKSFVRRLLGNGKWYQLRLRSRWHYQFSTECKNFHKGVYKTVKTVYERENLGLSAEQVIGGFHGRLFGYGCTILKLRPKHVILWNRRNGFEHDWAQAACL